MMPEREIRIRIHLDEEEPVLFDMLIRVQGHVREKRIDFIPRAHRHLGKFRG